MPSLLSDPFRPVREAIPSDNDLSENSIAWLKSQSGAVPNSLSILKPASELVACFTSEVSWSQKLLKAATSVTTTGNVIESMVSPSALRTSAVTQLVPNAVAVTFTPVDESSEIDALSPSTDHSTELPSSTADPIVTDAPEPRITG